MKTNRILSLALLTGIAAAFSPLTAAPEDATPAAPAAIKDIRIVMETSKGKIEATLYASKTPMTCANFLNLSKRGYYDGLVFHRVIPDFMIQGGCPLGTGSGDPGYRFGDEFVPTLKHDKPGIFSMANAGPGTNGSQFFVTHVPTPHLNNRHTVFGTVTKGQNVVNSIVGKIQRPGWKGDGVGDKIVKITILDSTDDLFKAQASNLRKWNAILDARKK